MPRNTHLPVLPAGAEVRGGKLAVSSFGPFSAGRGATSASKEMDWTGEHERAMEGEGRHYRTYLGKKVLGKTSSRFWSGPWCAGTSRDREETQIKKGR